MNDNKFNFTYSAAQQNEIKKIREKYISHEPDRMEQLRALDASVYKSATAISIIIGVIGALIMGAGMSLVMTDLATILGAYEHLALPIGIALGLVGMVIAALAFPFYSIIVAKKRKKIAPEILRLTDELMK